MGVRCMNNFIMKFVHKQLFIISFHAGLHFDLECDEEEGREILIIPYLQTIFPKKDTSFEE